MVATAGLRPQNACEARSTQVQSAIELRAVEVLSKQKKSDGTKTSRMDDALTAAIAIGGDAGLEQTTRAVETNPLQQRHHQSPLEWNPKGPSPLKH